MPHTVRLAAVLKTDIVGFTRRSSTLSPTALATLLDDHKRMAVEAFHAHGGEVVKGEGDAFWVLFPSVRGAVLAAEDLHRRMLDDQLQLGDGRLRIRAAISAGDVVLQDNDIFGPVVNLTARVESVTPPDQTWLDQTAANALGDGELRTTVVDTFAFKGFERPMPVYRVERSVRAIHYEGRVALFTDMIHYTKWLSTALDEGRISEVEQVLGRWQALHARCTDYDGRLAKFLGDAAMMVFETPEQAMTFLALLRDEWSDFLANHPTLARDQEFRAAMADGDFYQLGTELFGTCVNVAARLLGQTGRKRSPEGFPVMVTGRIAEQLPDVSWQEVPFPNGLRGLPQVTEGYLTVLPR